MAIGRDEGRTTNMKIGIIGTGISGLTAARLLNDRHELTLFEANSYVGGHTNTIDVAAESGDYAVDTGFIVFNDWTYPNFIEMMNRLDVASQPTAMSFSVACERTGLEYNGTSLNTLFAQRRNLVKPKFWRMIREILRFNREAPAWLEGAAEDESLTLGAFLEQRDYSAMFRERYIIPMGAAIWSANRETMLAFPFRFFARFFKNHGMLSVNDRPQWRVIRGGSRTYVERLIADFKDRIRLDSPVRSVRREAAGVRVSVPGQDPERFDAVVIAAHANQALAMLDDPSEAERDILGKLPYQANEAALHTDIRLLPRRRRAWAAWNYRLLPEDRGRAAVTYNMNILQGLNAPETFCVTLNQTEAIDPAKVIRRIDYHHPLFTLDGVRAQARRGEINGVNRVYFCGAYWRNGFHEDGVVSAMEAVRPLMMEAAA